MKKIPFLIGIAFMGLASCQKTITSSSLPVQPASKSSRGLKMMSTDLIPNDIVPLLYKSLKKKHMDEQAETLRITYYNTLSTRKDYTKDALKGVAPEMSGTSSGIEVTGANLGQRTVSNVGVVLDGTWISVPGGGTVCLLQDIGWTSIDFNAMNSTAPDAFSTTLPSSGDFLGTVTQPKRMQAWGLPILQYIVGDGITSYTTNSGAMQYDSYIQDIGWIGTVVAPNISGTINPLRIQAIRINTPSYGITGHYFSFNDPAPSTQADMFVYYRVLIQDTGWEGWVSEEEIAGTTTQAKRLQAMQIRAYMIKAS